MKKELGLVMGFAALAIVAVPTLAGADTAQTKGSLWLYRAPKSLGASPTAQVPGAWEHKGGIKKIGYHTSADGTSEIVVEATSATCYVRQAPDYDKATARADFLALRSALVAAARAKAGIRCNGSPQANYVTLGSAPSQQKGNVGIVEVP